jgi:hypothetical protein
MIDNLISIGLKSVVYLIYIIRRNLSLSRRDNLKLTLSLGLLSSVDKPRFEVAVSYCLFV